MTARGRPTAPAVIPSHWRGPLPDSSLQQHLDTDDDDANTARGWTAVPVSLLHGGFPDLAVLVWAQLRLWSDDDERRTNYQALAEEARSGLGVTECHQGQVQSPRPTSARHLDPAPPSDQEPVHLPGGGARPHANAYAMIRRRDLGLMLGHQDDAHACEAGRHRRLRSLAARMWKSRMDRRDHESDRRAVARHPPHHPSLTQTTGRPRSAQGRRT